MFSTPRKLGVLCFILAVTNIVGLIMVTMCLIGQGVGFSVLFSWLLYLVTLTVIGLLLTISVRSFVQDSEFESSGTYAQIKKLKERIEELEHKLK